MLGPFQKASFTPCTQTSSMLTRSKKDSNTRRVIVYASQKEKASMLALDAVSFKANTWTYTLPTINDLISLVQQHGQGCYLWKADLSRGYRQLRVDPLDNPLMAIRHSEIQRLAGRLLHIAQCVSQGRKFVSRILSLLRGTPEDKGRMWTITSGQT